MPQPVNAFGSSVEDPMGSLFIQVLRLLPKNSLSRAVGRLSDLPIPEPLRALVFKTFAQQVGADLSETELDLAAYTSLNAFFTRRLRSGRRPVDQSAGAIVSPVDAVVSEMGRIEAGELTQTKGRSYTLAELLADRRQVEHFLGGWFFTLYLSPKDYHRVHSPAPGALVGYRYEPGHLFPVNAAAVQHVERLFCINERVAIWIDGFAPSGSEGQPFRGTPIAVVMVGATCVGRMTLAFDTLETNQRPARSRQVHYQDPQRLDRFDELGVFNLGSTVILLVGADSLSISDALRPGSRVRVGQRLARV
ncbi:MAG: archaetidylserine decarboxylase [Myxococcota bacterium]